MYAEAFNIYDLYKDAPESVSSGNNIFWHARMEIGASSSSYSIAHLQRMDTVVYHSQDTALIYFYDQQEAPEIEEKDYHYLLNVNSLRSKGISFGYQFEPAQHLSVELKLDIAKTSYLLDGDLQGELNFNQDRLSALVELDYAYYRDVIFERDVSAPEGNLAALNLLITHSSEKSSHVLKIMDLVNETRWRKAPRTKTKLNSDLVGGLNAQGQLQIRPFGSGLEYSKNIKQKLKARYYLENEFSYGKNGLLLNLNYVIQEYWLQMGYRAHLNHHQVSLLYSFKDRAIALSHKLGKHFEYGLTVDDLKIKEAHRIDLSINFKF